MERWYFGHMNTITDFPPVTPFHLVALSASHLVSKIVHLYLIICQIRITAPTS
jgi:hypothetical protein